MLINKFAGQLVGLSEFSKSIDFTHEVIFLVKTFFHFFCKTTPSTNNQFLKQQHFCY